ncbi:hypothetical protein [Nostoc sp.]|uniref:hypothetical protein n=1 Tax=Nostoc sp. TaxID=1180 RepID=UPI002FF7D3CF
MAIYDDSEDLLQHYDSSILGANLNTKRVSDSPEERLRQRSQFINEVVQYRITQKA